MTEIHLYTENLDLIYQQGTLLIEYIYQGFLQVITSIQL